MTMGDRIAILDGGELQQIGSPLVCYHEPANRFVAGFIGSPSMNFFAVDRDGHRLKHEEFTYDLSTPAVDTDDLPRRLTLGIRPEHIRITDGDERNVIQSEIEVVEPMGERTYVYIDIGGDTYTVSVEGSLDAEAGETVSIVFPESRVHLFDAETGTAIKNSDPDESIKHLPRA
jgi:multiple sugar transport system ATP-binding protein